MKEGEVPGRVSNNPMNWTMLLFTLCFVDDRLKEVHQRVLSRGGRSVRKTYLSYTIPILHPPFHPSIPPPIHPGVHSHTYTPTHLPHPIPLLIQPSLSSMTLC